MKKFLILFLLAVLMFSNIFFAQGFKQDVSYSISAELIPSDNYLIYTSELTYTNNSPDTLKEIYIRLHWNIFKGDSYASNFKDNIAVTNGVEIKSLEINNQPSEYFIDNTIMKIPLNKYLLKGETIKIKINADEEVPATGLRIGRSGRDYCVGHWFPAVCVYDKYGWQTDQYLGNGEFYEETGNYNVDLTLPATYLVFYTGSLLNAEEVLPEKAYKNLSTLSDEGIRTRIYNQFENSQLRNDNVKKTWKLKGENVRTFAFSAFENRIWDACKLNGVVINTVYNKDGEEFHIKYGMNAAIKAIEFFSKVFDKYPYPNVFVTEAENMGGGMEYPGITFVEPAGNTLYDYAYVNVIIHEIGHNWCPMIINSNETRDGFIDEGITNYFTECALEELLGNDDNLLKLPGILKTLVPSGNFNNFYYLSVIQNDANDITEPIMTHSDRYHSEYNYGINSYFRTVKIIRMLKYLIGEDAFAELFHEYYKRYSFKHVTPQELFDLIQEINGKYNGKTDISWFFDEWFYKTYKLDYALNSFEYEENNGEYVTAITVENLADAVMPADVEVECSDGEKHIIHFNADEFFKSGRFVTKSISLKSKPDKAVIDPDKWLFEQNRLNNSNSCIPKVFFHFNPLVEMLKFPRLDEYSVYWFPALAFNNVDGLKAGININGSYMGISKFSDLTITQGLKFKKNSFGADITLGDRIEFIGLQALGSITLFNYEGRRGGAIKFSNTWNGYEDYPSFLLSLSGNYFDAYDDAYFNEKLFDTEYNGQPDQIVKQRKYYWALAEIKYRCANDWLGSTLTLNLESGTVKHEQFNFGYQKITFSGIENFRIKNKNIISLRQFLGYSPGELPSAKKYYLATVNPVDEFSSYIYRTEGIISKSAREKHSVPWGEGYMRGYYNQNISGNVITTLNAEVKIRYIFSPVPVLGYIMDILSPSFFIDAGNIWNATENIKLSEFLSDYGFSLKIPLIMRFHGTNMLSFLEKMGINAISLNFPVYVSRPLQGEDKVKFRWILSFQTPL